MTRLCSLHSRRLDAAGNCPVCLKYEAEDAAKHLPIVTLNAESQAWLDRAVHNAKENKR